MPSSLKHRKLRLRYLAKQALTKRQRVEPKSTGGGNSTNPTTLPTSESGGASAGNTNRNQSTVVRCYSLNINFNLKIYSLSCLLLGFESQKCFRDSVVLNVPKNTHRGLIAVSGRRTHLISKILSRNQTFLIWKQLLVAWRRLLSVRASLQKVQSLNKLWLYENDIIFGVHFVVAFWQILSIRATYF